VPDNTDQSSTTRRKSRNGRRPSVAPREVVLGLDSLERGISLFAAGIAFILAAVNAVAWARNSPIQTYVKYPTGKKCPKAYPKRDLALCEHILRNAKGYWELHFFGILVIALCILFFALRRKRAGVSCFAVFLGLFLGLGAGLVFLFLGVWLIVRAYRLQKYGVAGMLSSNRVAKEMGDAKREGRSPKVVTESDGAAATVKPAAPPSASKRYTPKKPPRKRR
jgi:hypothetical protein